MKVLLINKFFHAGARSGGVGRHVLQLASRLAEAGHEVIPFGMKDVETPTNLSTYRHFVSNIEFDQVEGESFRARLRKAMHLVWSYEAANNLQRVIDETAPDVAHVHNAYHHLSPSIFAVLRQRGIPTVQTAHDYKRIRPEYVLLPQDVRGQAAQAQKEVYTPTPRSGTQRALLHGAFWLHRLMGVQRRAVTTTIVPSQFMKEQFAHYGQNPDALRVLPHPRPVEPDQQLVPFSERTGWISVGRLSPEKGFLEWMELYAQLPKDRREPWTLLGDGPQRSALEARIRKLGLQNDITLRGHVSPKEVSKAMRSARLLVAPTLVCESFGLVVLEAAAHGLPAFVSNRGALPELVGNDRGWAFSFTTKAPGDTSVESLLQQTSQEDVWTQRQQQAHTWAQHPRFSPSQYLRDIETIYKEAREQAHQK